MTESHWELGHILSIGTSGGRWHLPKPHARNTALCGKFGYRSFAEIPQAVDNDARILLMGAPMCFTCQHIRRGK